MSVLHILQQFYTYVNTLSSALDHIVPSWKEEGESANAAHTDGILVASDAPEFVDTCTVPPFVVRHRTASQSELISRVIGVRCIFLLQHWR